MVRALHGHQTDSLVHPESYVDTLRDRRGVMHLLRWFLSFQSVANSHVGKCRESERKVTEEGESYGEEEITSRRASSKGALR